ncbi:Gx transporter family protein [Ruminococcus flavefaciens]|uniref:Gx transporter family protein n=1 Tax=Ruminococcus flavefaciens TaxID=1265 RepID=UPI0026F0F702|nr:Gx transporter family protein [Ruminococcus flavefaciens]MDD7515650.1 Gx transporter family protein [Ruminococcus flavefaciens]MDY5690345.1 Gx transporter family protein [Ruminococcus flavefaciens]
MKTKRLAELALLTAVALIIFIVELRIPDIIPIPGVKLGLANIITVYAVYKYSAKETAMIVFARVLLGAIFGGNISAMIYSMSGAVFCLVGMLAVKKIVPMKYIWLSSILGAILHNTGQIFIAIVMMKSFAVLSHYPFLIISGCIAGCFTGICAQLLLKRGITANK